MILIILVINDIINNISYKINIKKIEIVWIGRVIRKLFMYLRVII